MKVNQAAAIFSLKNLYDQYCFSFCDLSLRYMSLGAMISADGMCGVEITQNHEWGLQ